MNLGSTYFLSFAAIMAFLFAIAFTLASSLRCWRCSWRTIAYTALPIWLALVILTPQSTSHQVFAALHQWQNKVLPKEGCLTYEPDFNQLYSTYAMTRDEFETWVHEHPWPLQATGDISFHDADRFGFDDPELSFETEMAPSGKQLRVYYKSGVMHVSYNSM